MIALDTNVLVRAIIEDGPQSEAARALIAAAEANGTAVLITHVALVETIWTLRRAYRRNRGDIATVLELLLRNPLFRFTSREVVRIATLDYINGRADFADYLIAAEAELAGAGIAYSFDIDAVKSGRFRAVT